jgi:phosphomethylpyrimidine synthase
MSKIKVKIKNKRNGRELLIGNNYLPVVFPYGLSPQASTVDDEIKKIQIAESMGADMIKDNTIGRKEWFDLLKKAAESTDLCIGASATIAAANMAFEREGCYIPRVDDFYSAFEKLSDVCDAIEVFPTITDTGITKLEKSRRVLKTSTSRAGSIMMKFMKQNQNPFYSDFDWFLDYAKKKDITLILGNGFRASNIADSLDELQTYEMELMKTFAERAVNKNVKIIAGIFGHVNPAYKERIKEMRENIEIPIGGLGPLLTDVSLGYDHLNAAIGIVLLRDYIDWVSLITPAEHICLPTMTDVYDGMAAVNIARHILDLRQGKECEKDYKMALARVNLDWEEMKNASVNPYSDRINKIAQRLKGNPCSMCGEWCPIYQSKR